MRSKLEARWALASEEYNVKFPQRRVGVDLENGEPGDKYNGVYDYHDARVLVIFLDDRVGILGTMLAMEIKEGDEPN